VILAMALDSGDTAGLIAKCIMLFEDAKECVFPYRLNGGEHNSYEHTRTRLRYATNRHACIFGT
jgi:hypothetical protein